jgi:hypothetical protein
MEKEIIKEEQIENTDNESVEVIEEPKPKRKPF